MVRTLLLITTPALLMLATEIFLYQRLLAVEVYLVLSGVRYKFVVIALLESFLFVGMKWIASMISFGLSRKTIAPLIAALLVDAGLILYFITQGFGMRIFSFTFVFIVGTIIISASLWKALSSQSPVKYVLFALSFLGPILFSLLYNIIVTCMASTDACKLIIN